MIIDVHCHYTLSRTRAEDIERFAFEPLDPPESEPPRPTAFDSCISPRAARRIAWQLARRWKRLPPPGPALDRALTGLYARHLDPAAGPIDRFVLLAFDAVREDDGTCPPLPRRGDRFGSDIYTSNSLIRHLCRQHPERYRFGASVHPYRPDAPACIEAVYAAGACLLKWLPLHHNINAEDGRTRDALQLCARLGLPVLVHYGPEFTLATHRPEHGSVEGLLRVLRELRRRDAMPTTIVAHVATPPVPWGNRRSYQRLLAALAGEFADAPLYADISSLAAWGKVGFLRALARRPSLHGKLLFGSDFPVPVALPRLRRELGPAYGRVRTLPSWPQQAAVACLHAGFCDVSFRRAATLLPNGNAFAARPPGPA